MTVSFKLVRESFASRVTLDRPKLQILVEYLQGPFSHMQNRWTFRPDGDGACDVDSFIDYEFRSRMFGLLMGGMFDVAFRRFAAAFEARADQMYGRRNGLVLGQFRQHRERFQHRHRRTSPRPMSPKRRSR